MKIAPIGQNFSMCQSSDQEREKKKKTKTNTWELNDLYKLV